MPYVLKQKFNVAELSGIVKPLKRALLVISEEVLRDIYFRLFLQHDFDVRAVSFGDHRTMTSHLNSTDLLVIDLLDSQNSDRMEFLKILSRDFPAMSVITVGYQLSEQTLNKIMALGVVGHLDRKFSRPEDLVKIAKSIKQF